MTTVSNHLETDDRGILVSCPKCNSRNRMTYQRLGQTFRCGQCHNELPPPAEPIEISSEAAFTGLTTGSALPVLVDFWAPWCPPCRAVAPEIAKVAAATAGRYVVAKANTEELQSIAGQFQIASIPTMVVFKSGREVARQSGAMPAATIQQFVDRVAG